MSAFDKVIGYQEEKKELMQLCDMLRNREHYERLGAEMPRGLLLYGDPGLGKSLMAKCFMEETGWKSYTIRRSKPNGDFVRDLSRTFLEASRNAPAIILLDDMDKFVVEEKAWGEYVAVQAGIDEIADKNVYVIATANSLEGIPDSLLRMGRFDRKMEIRHPSEEDAVKIIDFYLSTKKLGHSVDFADVAKMLGSSSCAELEAVLNEAAIYAGYERSEQLEMRHIVDAALRSQYSAQGEEPGQNDRFRWKISYHEAGHAAMLDLVQEGGVGLVSVRPSRSGQGGFTKSCISPRTKEGNILIALAGIAAVELKYGVRDIGGSDDLQRAARQIKNAVNCYGLYGIGLMGTDWEKSDTLFARQETALAVELERYLTMARTILAQNMEFLNAVAGELYEKGTLLNSDICRIRTKCAVKSPAQELWAS